MDKFKVGDRVKRILDIWDTSKGFKFGKIYQRISRTEYPELYQVRFDNQDEMEIFLPHGLEKE